MKRTPYFFLLFLLACNPQKPAQPPSPATTVATQPAKTALTKPKPAPLAPAILGYTGLGLLGSWGVLNIAYHGFAFVKAKTKDTFLEKLVLRAQKPLIPHPHNINTPENSQVILVGDSTLDNILWATPSIAELLRRKSLKVYNLAADIYTTADVLDTRRNLISFNKRHETGDDFPSNIPFKPLEWLASANQPQAIVVLSVGGNDIREKLTNLDPSALKKTILELQKNYKEIVEEILKTNQKLVLMMQYKPDYNHDTYGVYRAMGALGGDAKETLNALLRVVYEPILVIAREHNLPVLDLPNTFDPTDPTLYVSQIEPSVKGGQIIADLIDHVHQNHDFNQASRLYSKDLGRKIIKSQENTQDLVWKTAKDSAKEEQIYQALKKILE